MPRKQNTWLESDKWSQSPPPDGASPVYSAEHKLWEYVAQTETVPVATFAFKQGTYTGDGIAKSITGLGFAPKVVVIKGATGTERAAGIRTQTMSAGRIVTAQLSARITSLDADGFSVDYLAADAANVNESGIVYYWYAFGGQSVVLGTYTGTSATQSITGTGLPVMVWVIPDTTNTSVSFRTTDMTTESFDFGLDDGETTEITSLDPNGFTVGTHGDVNGSGSSYHFVVFNASAGLHVGTYTGDDTDNRSLPATAMSFNPELVHIKGNASTEARFTTSSMTAGDAFGYVDASAVTNRIQSLTIASGKFQIGSSNEVNFSSIGSYYFFAATSVGTSAIGQSPSDASYVLIGASPSLPNDRVLTEGTGIDITDGGAGGNVTVTVDLSELDGGSLGGTPGGELGGTWASPTVDATHSGTPHHSAVTASGAHTVTGQDINAIAASATLSAHVELATTAETTTGTDTARVPPVSALPSQIQDSKWVYAADAVGTDAYAITLAPAPAAYAIGQVFYFKAGTANTAACTLNVNGLGAKTIKKLNDQDTATGDIEAGQVVQVAYDGTNFQMQSMTAAAASGGVSPLVLANDITHDFTAVDATHNDIAPTDLATANYITFTLSGGTSPPPLTGMVAQADQTAIFLYNAHSAAVAILHDSASSADANRFFCPSGAAGYILAVNAGVWVVYDADADGAVGKWVIAGQRTPTAVSTPDTLRRQYPWYIETTDGNTYLTAANALGPHHVTNSAYAETVTRIIMSAKVAGTGASDNITVQLQYNSGEDLDTESWGEIDSNSMGQNVNGSVITSGFTNGAGAPGIDNIPVSRLLRLNITSITGNWQGLTVVLQTSITPIINTVLTA